MRRRLPAVIAAVVTAAALSGAPAAATEAGGEAPAVTESPGGDAELPPGEQAPVEEGEASGEEVRGKFPLDLTQPYGIVGLVFLLIAGAFAAAAGRNVIAQMRGERPTADGSWRPR